MDNPEKLATHGIQDEEKQNRHTTQYVLDKQLEVKMIRTSFLCRNRNEHHNMELRT
jgi:hypothetical protein